MAQACVRMQILQKFYAISLAKGRPDLTTENHWLKKFHWLFGFFGMNKDILVKNLEIQLYVDWLYIYIYIYIYKIF